MKSTKHEWTLPIILNNQPNPQASGKFMKKVPITIFLMLAATTLALRALLPPSSTSPAPAAMPIPAPRPRLCARSSVPPPSPSRAIPSPWHAGVYREYVNPPRGGESDTKRNRLSGGRREEVVITGSEAVKKWEKVQDFVWKATLPNTFFGSFNPFAEIIAGDGLRPRAVAITPGLSI